MHIFLKKGLILTVSCWLLFGCGSGSSNNTNTAPEQQANAAPTVNAGGDLTANSGDTVVLNASITDDGTYTVQWTQTQGSTVTLDNDNSASISFTAPSVENTETLSFSVSVDDGVNSAVTDSVNVVITPSNSSPSPDQSVWIINSNQTRAAHIKESNSGLGVLVNVQTVSEQTVDNKTYTVVNSEGIPDYSVLITQQIWESLANRPRAASDFVNSSPLIEIGDRVEFGQDVGYASNNRCVSNQGFGYWPPGPECPSQSTRQAFFPTQPMATQQACENGLGKIGLWVNGSSIYNWGDGQSYARGVWQNLAPVAEQYDVDICGGHAANGDYHHHFYSTCLAEMVGDKGDSHSPLYGYAADGYPVYGPYEASGLLARSAWVVRDYSNGSQTGCSDGKRSCILLDPYDISKGTETVTQGPEFDQIVNTLSGNQLTASNGYYYEDYYWNSALSALGSQYLDQYNGHSDDERGYHYHITVTEQNGKLTPAFPYIIGTRFAGELAENALTQCGGGNGGPPPQGSSYE